MAQAKAFSKWKSQFAKAGPNLAIRDVTMAIQNGETSGPLDARQPQIKVGCRVGGSGPGSPGLAPADRRVGGAVPRPDRYLGQHQGWASDPHDLRAAGWPGRLSLVCGSIPCDRTGQHGVALRILPKHPDLVNVYEPGLILWESTS